MGFDPSTECMEHKTEWSACSRSCGMGVSTRVTNQNHRCELVKQNRLCMVRPCQALEEQANPQVRNTENTILLNHSILVDGNVTY